MRLTGHELKQATDGVWRKSEAELVEGISTDTRQFRAGNAFLALRGPHFDGHCYAAEVADQANALIGDREGVRLWDNLTRPQLEVHDTLVALGDIANAWRQKLPHTTVVAITGSYGKTTVRSMMHHVFTILGIHCHATKANLNNLVGVPLTLLEIPPEAEVALIECGISETGEMERLASIVAPDVAVLTGLTTAHGEGLGGLHGVIAEKTKMMDHLTQQGWILLGEGVKELLAVSGKHVNRHHPLLDPQHADYVQWELQGRMLTLRQADQQAHIELMLPARHWAANMALVATMLLHWFALQGREIPSLADVAMALQHWTPPGGRMRLLQGSTLTVIDDCYNANPVSMQVALDTLAALQGHRVAIIGDMAELGEDAARLHRQLCLHDVDEVILIGPLMLHLADAHPHARSFTDIEEAEAWLENHRFPDGSTVLLKASRSMQLERLLPLLGDMEVLHAV